MRPTTPMTDADHPDAARRRTPAAPSTTTISITMTISPNWNNLHQPVNAGRWDHNGFWNSNWNARNFNCYNCRWGWVGPVFWPFGWGDMFSFAWWPYAETSPFWNYNVDYIMGGLFWPNGAYAWPSGGYGATAWTQTDNSYTYARESHQDIYSSGPADGSDDKQAAAAADDSTQPGSGDVQRLCARRLELADRQDRAERQADRHAAHGAEEPGGCIQPGRGHPQGLVPELSRRSRRSAASTRCRSASTPWSRGSTSCARR